MYLLDRRVVTMDSTCSSAMRLQDGLLGAVSVDSLPETGLPLFHNHQARLHGLKWGIPVESALVCYRDAHQCGR